MPPSRAGPLCARLLPTGVFAQSTKPLRFADPPMLEIEPISRRFKLSAKQLYLAPLAAYAYRLDKIYLMI